MKEFLQELVKQKSSMLILSGIFLLLLGITSGLQTEKFSIAVEPAYRIVSIIFGTLLILIGVILAWKDSSRHKPIERMDEDKYLGRDNELRKTSNSIPQIKDQDIQNSTVKDGEPPSVPNNNTTLHRQPSRIPDDILDIFRGEFVKPKECRQVSIFLRDLANNIALEQQDLNLQLALKRSILALASQVDRFRKICEPVTTESDKERIEILAHMEKIARYFPN